MKKITLNMINLLPSWMKIKQDPSNTQGGQFLDTIGTQISDIIDLLEGVLRMKHPASEPFVIEDGKPYLLIQGVDLFNIDYVYRIKLPQLLINRGSFAVTGDNTELRKCENVFSFYKLDNYKKYYFDEDDGYIYLRENYESVVINGTPMHDIEEHHIWGPYDEVGLLIGCPRLPAERNIDYRARLLDVFFSEGSSTKRGLINYISRSLGLEKEEVGLFEFTEEYVTKLFHDNHSLPEELWEFFELADKINSSSGATYWDVIDNYNRGVKYLPIYWGASLDDWKIEDIQSGIGYDDDLEISPPEQIDTRQEFQYHVGVEGLKLTPNHKYPDIRFKYKVFSKGYMYGDEGIKPEPYSFTLFASKRHLAEITVRAEKVFPGRIPAEFYNFDYFGDGIDMFTGPDYWECEGLANDTYTAGEAVNYNNTNYLYQSRLNLMIRLTNKPNKEGRIDGLTAVDLVCRNNTNDICHVILTPEDQGQSGYSIEDGNVYIDMTRPELQGVWMHYEGVEFVDGVAKVSAADHIKWFKHKTAWERNDKQYTKGIGFTENGSIVIKGHEEIEYA